MKVVVDITKTYYELCKVCVENQADTPDQKIIANGIPVYEREVNMGPDEFNAAELYYQLDGGEFKLLPIKPLTISEIEAEQSKLDAEKWIENASIDYEAIITHADELFRIIEVTQQHYDEQNNLYCICEMAKRYLYLLKEKEKDNEQV